jgi:hypothetical protein
MEAVIGWEAGIRTPITWSRGERSDLGAVGICRFCWAFRRRPLGLAGSRRAVSCAVYQDFIKIAVGGGGTDLQRTSDYFDPASPSVLCSRGITLLRCSYDPLRLPSQASVGTSASGLISSVSTASIGEPGGVSSLTPLLCPCMLPPSPREPRWLRSPNSSTIDGSLRPTTGGSATPFPALAALTAGSTLTGAHRLRIPRIVISPSTPS